uniref:Transcription factor Adf-1 n=1 Tax=Bactrocera dorsalis TaxID=27457 RepID=A0A034VTT5_BACDO
MDVNKKINMRLVETVEKYPCLYNNTLKEYSNRNCTEAAWVEVAEELSSTPDVVKDKWKVFRSIFVRRLKKMHMGELIKPYYLHEHMQFLIPYLRKSWDPECCNKILLEESESRVTPKNLKENKDSNSSYENSNTLDQEDINSVYLADTPQYSCHEYKGIRASDAKHRINEFDFSAQQFKISEVSSHQQDQEATDDEDYKRLFILSLLPDLEGMSNAQMRKFKIKVTAIINNIINNE